MRNLTSIGLATNYRQACYSLGVMIVHVALPAKATSPVDTSPRKRIWGSQENGLRIGRDRAKAAYWQASKP